MSDECGEGPRKRIASAIEAALSGERITVADIAALLGATGRSAWDVCGAADMLRERLVGDTVTYVVNRNINFTNICSGTCLFCNYRSDKGYVLSMEEIAQKAQTPGITEVCVQGGINPSLAPSYYFDILRTIREVRPDIHIHAFSPEEVCNLSSMMGASLEETLASLRSAGLGSMPGTAAEVLSDRVRSIICPDKLSASKWVDVITAAHEAGIRTTSTIMYGHIETIGERAGHLETLRGIQERTGGFTEFIPLSFMPDNALGRTYGLGGAAGMEDLLMYAASRLAFGRLIPHIQTSWVKLGMKLAGVALSCGADDIGGTLYEEKISKASGARHGELVEKEALEQHIRNVGKVPIQRTTLYGAVAG